MKTYLYRASNLKSIITFLPQFLSGSQFLAPAKKHRFLRFIHNQSVVPRPRIVWLLIVRIRGRSLRTSTIFSIISEVTGYK